MEKSKDSDMDYSDMQQMKNVSKSKLFQKFMKKQNEKSESTPKRSDKV